VKDRKSVRTPSTELKLAQQLAASNATADSRANETTNRRKESSETDTTHNPDHKVLVVLIQDITLVLSTSTCLPLCHGLFSLSLTQSTITKLFEPIWYLPVAARVVKDFYCEGPTKASAVH
jgi:hypothetical protein